MYTDLSWDERNTTPLLVFGVHRSLIRTAHLCADMCLPRLTERPVNTIESLLSLGENKGHLRAWRTSRRHIYFQREMLAKCKR